MAGKVTGSLEDRNVLMNSITPHVCWQRMGGYTCVRHVACSVFVTISDVHGSSLADHILGGLVPGDDGGRIITGLLHHC